MEKNNYRMLEVEIKSDDDYKKVKETLTRIGITSRNQETNENTLWQSCHILRQDGRYYVVHFKELFRLDGREDTFDEVDASRRNAIAFLLDDWGLLRVLEPESFSDCISIQKFKILTYDESKNWNLRSKYSKNLLNIKNGEANEKKGKSKKMQGVQKQNKQA